MINIWKPVDAIADWVQGVPIEIQERVAVIAILVSIPLFFYAPFSGEPLLIYMMSAFALTIGGLSGLWALVASRKVEDEQDNEVSKGS